MADDGFVTTLKVGGTAAVGGATYWAASRLAGLSSQNSALAAIGAMVYIHSPWFQQTATGWIRKFEVG